MESLKFHHTRHKDINDTTHVVVVAPVDVHLAQTEEGQHEGSGGELRGLVVVLEGLVVVLLHVEGPRQLVAALRPHGLVLRVVEGVQGQVLHLLIVLLQRQREWLRFFIFLF